MGENNLSVVPFSATPGSSLYRATATNADAVVTVLAIPNKRVFIAGIAWSYSLAPVGTGNLKIEHSIEGVYFDIDLTQDGPGFLYFRPALLVTNSLLAEVSLTFTLVGGGPGSVGKLNLLGVASE